MKSTGQDSGQITGKTRLFPIIGHPVSGVFSPPAFNALFREHGIDAVMVALDLSPDALPAFWTMMRGSSNLLGCSVTYPHKQAAFDAVDDKTPRAARLGALNTVRRNADGTLTGDATDGQAMVSAMAGSGVSLAGKTAHVVGAGGGAGLAIVDALAEAGIGAILIEEIDPARRAVALNMLQTCWPWTAISSGEDPVDILINATTLGKSPADPLPFPEEAIAAASLCCDVVTGPADTAFIQAARRDGKAVVDGDAMGRGQLASQLAFIGLDRVSPPVLSPSLQSHASVPENKGLA